MIRGDYGKSARYCCWVSRIRLRLLESGNVGSTNKTPGSGESGKSTIVKQMKIIHQNGYSQEELSQYRLTIYKNLVDCSKALIGAMRQLEIEPKDPANVENCELLLEFQVDPDPQTSLDPKIGAAALALWKDECMESVLERQSEFYLMDSAP